MDTDHYYDASCQAAVRTLNINVLDQKGKEKKHIYAPQSIAQMLAYITQQLGKSKHKSAMD